MKETKVASDLIINFIKPIAEEHKLPQETLNPVHLAMLVRAFVEGGVSMIKIRKFITDIFDKEVENKCIELGFPVSLMRHFDELEVIALTK